MAKQIEKPDESRTVRSQRGNSHGYIVEWRWKPGINVIWPEEMSLGDMPYETWKQAPYDIKQMVAEKAIATRSIIQPHLTGYDAALLSPYGLVGRVCAEAILPCLRSMFDARNEQLSNAIELRITACEVTYDWKVVTQSKEKDD